MAVRTASGPRSGLGQKPGDTLAVHDKVDPLHQLTHGISPGVHARERVRTRLEQMQP